MGTTLRQWTIRLLAAGALPIMLALGVGATASAQTTLASPMTGSTTGHASPHFWYRQYGPYYSYQACSTAQRQYRDHYSYCESQHEHQHRGGRNYDVWYLFVRYPR